MKIEELGLSTRAYNCLIKAGITTVEELQEKHEDEIVGIRGMGRTTIDEIRIALQKAENNELDTEPVIALEQEEVKESVEEESVEEESEEEAEEESMEAPVIDKYKENIGIIKQYLIEAAMDFCAIGYYLKEIRDKEQFKEAGYSTIWECAQAEFGLSKSAASRHMNMNDMYSIGGNSPELDKKYISFNKSQLQEMLSLPETEREKVTPTTTVTEIRKLNPNSKASKEPEPVAISQQPEVMTKVITSIPEPVKPVEEPEEEVKPVPPYQRGCITGKNPNGTCACCGNGGTVGCCAQCTESCNVRCGWLDEVTTNESIAISQQEPAEDPVETIIDGGFREIVEETPAITQLELPVLKNMEEREQFIRDYKKWPVWTKNELTEETFYRYDLPDGSSIVVRSYPTWLSWSKKDTEQSRYYLLVPGYRHFADTECNMTFLKDHLKEIQKNKKIG